VKTDQYKQAQLKNECKLAAHAVLKMFRFCLRHLSTGKVKHFLAATQNNNNNTHSTAIFHN